MTNASSRQELQERDELKTERAQLLKKNASAERLRHRYSEQARSQIALHDEVHSLRKVLQGVLERQEFDSYVAATESAAAQGEEGADVEVSEDTKNICSAR